MAELLASCTPARKTELGELLQSLTDRIKRRGLLVIVSDLFTDLDAVYDGLNRLRFLGHEVLVLQVLDRDELDLPFDGPTVFQDIEGDEELYAEPGSFRQAYQKAISDFLDEVKRECGNRGYDHVRFLHRRAAGRDAGPVPPVARRVEPVGGSELNHVQLPEPAPGLGAMLWDHPDHHPPAQPAPVPPGRVGADALPPADDPPEPAPDPDRAVDPAPVRIALPVLLFLFLARPV